MKNPHRAELATAIKEVAKIEAEYKARQGVLDRASALVDKALVGLQKAQQEAAEAREGVHTRLLEAVTNGLAIPDDATAAAREARLAVADAEDAYANALATLDTVQRTADPSDNSLSEAQARVRQLAGAILGGAIDDMLRESSELNEALSARRLALGAITRYVEPSERERINNYLSAPIFPAQLAPDAHPVTLAWRRAFDALLRDASTELPHAE